MVLQRFLLFLSVLLLFNSSQALFFQYSRNALTNFFTSLREKKEMKFPIHPPLDIYHYHLHYYPVPVPTYHTTNIIKIPDKQEQNNVHTTHLQSTGWNDNEFQHSAEPAKLETWSNTAASVPKPWAWDNDNSLLDRHGEARSHGGILVQIPFHQQLIFPQVKQEEKEPEKLNPLLTFFKNLRRIKDTIFQSSSDDGKKSEDESHNKLNAFVVYPSASYTKLL